MQIDPKYISFTESEPDPLTGCVTLKATLKHTASSEVPDINMPGAREYFKALLTHQLENHLYGEARKAALTLKRSAQVLTHNLSEHEIITDLWQKLKASLRFADPEPVPHDQSISRLYRTRLPMPVVVPELSQYDDQIEATLAHKQHNDEK